MKAARFDYVRAGTLEEVCERLAERGAGETMLIAGGQTLVPLMAMRLTRPDRLVDVNHVDSLGRMTHAGDELVLGATVRQATALRSSAVADAAPLLVAALAHVGHPPTRARGTIGGSIASADPAAEIPLVAAVLDAGIESRTVRGARRDRARDFLLGPLETTLEPDACLTAIRLARWSGPGIRVGAGFEEVAVRPGDFALLAAAAQVALDADGVCRRVACGIANVAATPLCSDGEALLGTRLESDRIDAFCRSFESRLDPPDDLHASAAYRRRIAPALLARALGAAAASARCKEIAA